MITSSTPQLIFTAEPCQSIELTKQNTWTVGRSSANSIVLNERSVSRQHAKLEVLNNRHCYFVDLNSSNGSQVNQEQVTETMLLKHGDVISIGDTEIRFHFPYVTHSAPSVPFSSQKVLMMQDSAIQGIIWQEILCSQGFEVQWIPPGADLRRQIGSDAAANIIPDLLLVDLAAYKGDELDFCAWCNRTYPHLPLFLTLSKEILTPILELNLLLPIGSGKILPALPSRNLPMNIGIFAEQLKSVLDKVSGSTFNQENLVMTLNSLEELLNLASISPPIANQSDDNAELDEFTILKHHKKSLTS